MKLNAFSLLSFSIIIFLVSIIILNNSKKELNSYRQIVTKKENLAYKLQSLKQNWSIESSNKKLQKILNSASNSLNIKVRAKGDLKVIQITSNNINALDSFVNKILNSNIIINSIFISKNKVILEVNSENI